MARPIIQPTRNFGRVSLNTRDLFLFIVQFPGIFAIVFSFESLETNLDCVRKAAIARRYYGNLY